MRRFFVCEILGVALLLSLAAVALVKVTPPRVVAAEPATDTADADPKYQTAILPFLRQHCVRCHNAEKAQGDLRLDQLEPDFDQEKHAGLWVEVMDRLNLGEMPPADQPRPTPQAHQEVVRWIAGELRAAQRRKATGGGHVLMRRLNRTEFSNTIRDLLHMRFLPGDDPGELLPPDATLDGFEKASTALMLDSSLLDSYYNAAEQVANQAIVTGPPKFPTERTRFELEDMALPGSGFTYVCGHSGTECREHDVALVRGYTRTARGLYYPGTTQLFPVKGRYAIRVRASADQAGSEEPVRMYVLRQSGREGNLLEVDVTATPEEPQVYSVERPMVDLPQAFGVYMTVGVLKGPQISVGMPNYWNFHKAMEAATKSGEHAKALRLQARMQAEGWVGGNRPAESLLKPDALPRLFVDWIEIEGPLYEQWPPKSHETLFFKSPETSQTLEYAREIFTRFLPRAYRRPVTDTEVERLVGLVESELAQGASFTDAIKLGVTYILASPDFLYIVEYVVEPATSSDVRELNDYELASRLSYFLWSSMPDEELFELASQQKLSDPDVLRRQVRRMIEDPKSQALVEGFAAQWLKTREFLNFEPDRKIYREFDPALREQMVQETLTFFEEILRHDLSVLNFIDSDFVMVNSALAKFYGLPDVEGEDFRRVPVPADSPRGGLLAQGGVALWGSDGVRTKPVSRGVYVREVLFNDPPDPPPPNVGEIEPNIQGEQLTVRERLIQHQQIEACASCHRGIDCFGLALENFDITGAWRTHQNGEDFRGNRTPPIVISGTLPNGKKFESFPEFKALLLEQQDRFRRALLEKLFLYALGRPTRPEDRPAIDAAVAEMVEQGDSLTAGITALVTSPAFLQK